MPYIADPTNPTQPTEDINLVTAAAEFRAIKAYMRDDLLEGINESTAAAQAAAAAALVAQLAAEAAEAGVQEQFEAYEAGMAPDALAIAIRTETARDEARAARDLADGYADAAAASAVAAQAVATGLALITNYGYRNKLINGAFSVNQRATSPNADATYALDRWLCLTENGTVTMTATPHPEVGATWALDMVHADAPKRMGFAQIIRHDWVQQFRTAQMTLSGRLNLSIAGNLRYAILETVGPLGSGPPRDLVNNWASTVYTAGNFFHGSWGVIATGVLAVGAAAWTTLLNTAALSANTNRVAIFVWTENPVAAGVVLKANRLQYEPGIVQTQFEYRHNEFELCRMFARRKTIRIRNDQPLTVGITLGHTDEISPALQGSLTGVVIPTILANTSTGWTGVAASTIGIDSCVWAATPTAAGPVARELILDVLYEREL